jgi:hypothetical protein
MLLLGLRLLDQLAALHDDFGEAAKAGELSRLRLPRGVFDQRRTTLTDQRQTEGTRNRILDRFRSPVLYKSK